LKASGFNPLALEVKNRFQSFVFRMQLVPLTRWAKIELPAGEAERKAARETLAKRYPVEAFEAKRKELDPKVGGPVQLC
jgi:hypothetical protein